MNPSTVADYLRELVSGSLARIQRFANEYPQVTRYWVLVLLASSIIAISTVALSNELTRQNTVNPLLIGVITLFTINLTVTIMGIRVATNRYSHKVDSTVLQKSAIWLHFIPHLIAILFAIF